MGACGREWHTLWCVKCVERGRQLGDLMGLGRKVGEITLVLRGLSLRMSSAIFFYLKCIINLTSIAIRGLMAMDDEERLESCRVRHRGLSC